MVKIDEVLEILRILGRNNGNLISLSSVYKNVIREGIYDSYPAISNCLKRLESIGKIKLINFGNSIELLEKENIVEKKVKNNTEYVQASLFDLKRK